jgi:hypothetical protein
MFRFRKLAAKSLTIIIGGLIIVCLFDLWACGKLFEINCRPPTTKLIGDEGKTRLCASPNWAGVFGVPSIHNLEDYWA